MYLHEPRHALNQILYMPLLQTLALSHIALKNNIGMHMRSSVMQSETYLDDSVKVKSDYFYSNISQLLNNHWSIQEEYIFYI